MDGNLDLSVILDGMERWRKTKLRFILFLGFVNVIFAVVSLVWFDIAWYWSLLIFVIVLATLNGFGQPLLKRR